MEGWKIGVWVVCGGVWAWFLTSSIRKSKERDKEIEEAEKRLRDYNNETEICPTCYGRGRVAKPGFRFQTWETDEINYRKYKETLEAQKGIPRAFIEEIDNKDQSEAK